MKNLIFKSFLMVIFFVAAQDMSHAQYLQTLIHKAYLAVIVNTASFTPATTSTTNTSFDGQNAGTSTTGKSSQYPDRAGNPNTKMTKDQDGEPMMLLPVKKIVPANMVVAQPMASVMAGMKMKGTITDKLLPIGMAQ